MVNAIDSVVLAISNVLYQPFIVPLILVLGGIIFTVRTKFMQVGMFR